MATPPFVDKTLTGPLGLVGDVPVPNIETRTEEQYFQDVTTPSGVKPIRPDAATPPPADPFAGFQDANFDQFQDAPDAFSNFPDADDLDIKSVEELDKDRENFRPADYFANNPNVASDPKKLAKLLEVYRRRDEEGLTAKGVVSAAVKQTPGLVADIGGGIKRFGERAIDITVQPVANVVLGALTGDLFDDQKRAALFNETRKIVRKGAAEVGAGSEAATVGLVDLARTGARKIPYTGTEFEPIPLPKPKTDQELLRQLSDDASFRQVADAAMRGEGEAAKNLGLDKETLAKQGVVLDENAIRQLSLVDPITMVATGGAFKLVGAAGKVLATAQTLEGAKFLADKLAGAAKFSAGKAIQGTGKVIGATGRVARGLGTSAGTIAGVSSAVSGGGIPQSLIVAGATKLIGPTLRRAGPAIEHAGKAIAGEVPISANLQKVLDYTRPGRAVLDTAAAGTFQGIAAASPFAVAAQDDETAGALFGAGAALGAAGATGAGALRVVKNSAARRYFGENRPVLPDVASPGYGKDTALDTQHQTNIAKLSAQDASDLNNFREALRQQGGEIYAVDAPTWRAKIKEAFPDITDAQLDIYQNHSAFFDKAIGPDRKVVYLNADTAGTSGLKHDAGHIFDAVLSPEKRTELRTAVKDAFGEKAVSDFRETYERRVGNKISEEAALDEFIAEQFNALFHNVPVTELNAPKTLLDKFIDTAADAAETLGIDLSAGATTPGLNAPVAVGIRQLFRNAAGDVTRANIEGIPATNVTPFPGGEPSAPPVTPPPAGPGNVVPLPGAPSRNIRVTPENVAAFKQSASPEIRAAADARARETGVDYARTEAKKDDGSPTSRIIESISDSMESGNPVVNIEHLGITSASTPEAALGRTARRGEQSAGYAALEAAQLDVRQNAPPEIVNQHSKNFVPVRWTDQGGSPTLIAMSLDKVIANMMKVAADPKAKDLIPYPVENGKFTAEGWKQVVADAQAYAENQANGRKGDGGRLEVPEAGLSIPAENPAYTPQILSPERANFQNLVQGLAPPQTARAQKGVTPGNVKGQLLAEANLRPTETPANITPSRASKQAFVEFPGRTVQEVNPLRNELERRGVKTRELIEVTERIRAKDIVSSSPRPDVTFKAPVTDIIRGGFLPAPTEFRQKNLGGRTVEEFSDYVLKATPEEWKAATDNMTGGLTGGAWNLGLGLKNAADVGVLKAFQEKLSNATKEAMKSGNFDAAYSLVSKGQFFREAYEAATGTGSAGAAFKRGQAGMEAAKPPFPQYESTQGTAAAGAQTKPINVGESGQFSPGKKKKGQTAGEYFQSVQYDTPAERRARMESVWVKGKKIEPAIPGDEATREAAGWISATVDPNRSIGFGYHDDFPLFDYLPEETKKTVLNYAKHQNLDVVYNGEGIAKRDPTLGPDEVTGAFQPAEELPVGDIKETAPPELKVVPPAAGAGGTRPPQGPTDAGPVIPPPVTAGFLPADDKKALTGLAFKDFFSKVTKGEFGKSEVPWVPVRDITQSKEFLDAVKEHSGNFDEHIAKSIPGYRETQLQKGDAILKSYPEGARVLDVGGSEGAWDKAISQKSDGKIETVVADPNPDMAAFFREKSQVPGASYVEAAFVRGFDDDGTQVPAFDDAKKFDVVNESMVFQFISPERAEQVAEAKRLLKPGGIFLSDEKLRTTPEQWKQNEAKKDKDYKAVYFTNDELKAKDQVVGFQQAKVETKAIGMVDNMVQVSDYEKTLKDNFAHVAQYWDSGNFKGYVASDSLPAIETFLKNLGDTKTDFSTSETPRFVGEDAGFLPRTEAGRKLEERGFEIIHRGEYGMREVEIRRRNGEAVANIDSVQRTPKVAEIAMVLKYQGAPRGVGEVLYRELASQLKEDGVTQVEGNVIAPEPLAIRKKVFGGFKSIKLNDEPSSYEQAIEAAERIKNREETEVAAIEPINTISAASRFLPKRDEQGRPLKKSGEIDYALWQKETLAARKKRESEPEDYTPSRPSPKAREGAPTSATGWMTPDKKFVPLDTNFHEQYLADNAAELNKKFGTEFDPEQASGDNRLDALNAGFARFRNYNGRMNVEVNAAKFPALKSKIRDTLQDLEGEIDNLTVSLLNREGQEVDSVNVPRLFEMEPGEKLGAIDDAVNKVRGGGGFLPSERGLPGFEERTPEELGRAKAARRISTVKKNNPEAVIPQYARDENGQVIVKPDGEPKTVTLDYDFINAPVSKEAAKGLKGAEREAAATEAVGDELVKLYKSVEKNKDIKAGATWYSTARTRLKKVFGDDSKFFAELLGATSARTPVDINFRFALDAYNQFKAGAYDKVLAKYREGKAKWEAQDLGDFSGETRGQFMDYWVDKHDLTVRQSNGKKFGMNGRAVLRVLDGSWASEVQGPKTPNFAGNLTGETFEATIDVWAARTLARLASESGKNRWRILPENETGVTDADFYFGQAAYRSAAKKLGIKPDALQAVLWFAEKDHWEKKGWTRGAGAEKSDFNVLLSEVEKSPTGELRMKTPQIGLDFGADLGNISKKKK